MARKPVPDIAKIAATLGIAAVLLVVSATVFVWMKGLPGSDSSDQFAQCRKTKIAGGASVIGGPFNLSDENGVAVTDQDVITGPTLVYFGYSYCPDVCPLDGVRNAEVASLLRDANKPVGSLFITVDPERDTPEVMKEFTSYFDDEMIGLTGTTTQVAEAAKNYRVYFAKNGDGEDYLMDHSTLTYLMAPSIGLVEVFRRDLPAEEMADAVGCFVDRI